MKRASSKLQNPRKTLQSFLENFSAEVGQQFEIKGSFAANALRLCNTFVDFINENSSQFEKSCGHHSAAKIFESIRKLAIRIIAERAEQSFDFADLVDAYEFLLDQRLSGRAGCFKLVSSQSEKRKRGVFYTPDSLAGELTLLALRSFSMLPVERLLTLKIVDPAMGAGSFLFVALEMLTACVQEKLNGGSENDWSALNESIEASTEFRGGTAKLKAMNSDELKCLILNTVASNCLYGLDVDDAAVELVKIGMAKRCRLSPAASAFPNLRRGNSLVGLWQNPDDTVLSRAIAKISERVPDFECFHNIEIERLSDKQRRDLVCMQFFAPLVSTNENIRNLEQIFRGINFFHWNLEFADVFSGDNPGFDLVLTNPPWEVEKANSREFFSRYDASYMSLSKQAALQKQSELISDNTIEGEWRNYAAYHDGLSAFLQKSAELIKPGSQTPALMPGSPCDRNGANGAPPPFRHQGGGDSNSYKLFLELGYFLLKDGGVMAQIVPSGIYSDKGSTALRRLLVERCRWLTLHGYHNREEIFSIHRSFKFCTLVVVKGGRTDEIQCRFLRVSSDETGDGAVAYKIETLKSLSPDYLAFTEIAHASDLELIEKLARTCMPLGVFQHKSGLASGQDDISISFRREFDMTNDSKLFIERTAAQEDGFAPDSFGHWLKGAWRPVENFDARHAGEYAVAADGKSALAIDDIQRVLLPVYEGRMIGQYDWAKKAWLHGKGRRADWAELPFAEKKILPQYLLDLNDYLKMQPERGAKIAYLAVGASTNTRSCIAAMIGDWPCGNAVPVLSTGVDLTGSPRYEHLAALLACLNSFVFDFLLRMRLSANNLNWFILKECFVPDLTRVAQSRELLSAVYELSFHDALGAEGFYASGSGPARRLKLRAFVEALIAHAYSIDERDCRLILRGCELDQNDPTKQMASSIDKGFHRVDLHMPPHFRGPYLFFQCFQLLQQYGAKWLFENLDRDEVLFSMNSFERHHAVSSRTADQGAAAVAMSPVVHAEKFSPDCDKWGAGCDDSRQLMMRIRNAVTNAASSAKASKTRALRTQ
ncbi:MAG: hypothetical protein IT342_17240 [Candidatus Melainabacteria bacterium]|nr:hypothetical protein [Candidatus Melainabacteria bacterium]